MLYITLYIRKPIKKENREVNVNKNTDENGIYKNKERERENKNRQKYKDTGQQVYSH